MSANANRKRPRLGGLLACGSMLMLSLASSPVAANEIQGGAECAVGGDAAAVNTPLYGKFVAGWNHNYPSLTGDADVYSRPNNGNDADTNKNQWTEFPGVDTAVIASADPEFPAVPTQLVRETPAVGQAPAATGLTRYWEGTERTRYLLGGVTDPDLATAVANGRYLQYAFTTSSALQAGTFLKKVYLLSYSNAAFKYTVRASTDPDFGSYWTLAQDVQVTTVADNDSNNWQRFPQVNTNRFPVLAPGTKYYLRLYIYAATRAAVIANDSPTNKVLPPAGTMVVVADDFMFGTAVCPPPQVTISKVSRNRVGTFDFSGTNGYTSHSIVTTAAGTAVAASPSTLTTGYTQTEITEADNTAFKLTAISCPSLAASAYTTTPATSGSGGGKLTLNPEAVQWGSSVACTFTNDPADVDLSVTKSNAATALVSGHQTTYTLRVENKGPGPGDGAVLRDTPGAGLSGCVVSSCSASPTPAAQCPATPSNVLTAAGAPIPSLPKDGWVQLQVRCNVD